MFIWIPVFAWGCSRNRPPLRKQPCGPCILGDFGFIRLGGVFRPGPLPGLGGATIGSRFTITWFFLMASLLGPSRGEAPLPEAPPQRRRGVLKGGQKGSPGDGLKAKDRAQ